MATKKIMFNIAPDHNFEKKLKNIHNREKIMFNIGPRSQLRDSAICEPPPVPSHQERRSQQNGPEKSGEPML
jgi:hypothetical protein